MQNLFYKDTCCFLKKKGIYLKKRKSKWRIKQIYLFFITSHILYTLFTANLKTNRRKIFKQAGCNILLFFYKFNCFLNLMEILVV